MPPPDLSNWLASQWEAWSFFSPRHLVAHADGALAVGFAAAGALGRTMIPLRWLAVGSNLGVLAFGALVPPPATLAVAAVLLPINLYRLHEMVRLTRQVSAAEGGSDLSGLWLRPYMTAKKLRAGTVLFRRGDAADRLYLLAEGRMALVEIGQEIPAGRVFGEIALFSPAKRRTHSARCLTACTVLHISEDTVKQLYYQNPAFSFHLIGLVAARLSDDVERASPPLVSTPHAGAPADSTPARQT